MFKKSIPKDVKYSKIGKDCLDFFYWLYITLLASEAATVNYYLNKIIRKQNLQGHIPVGLRKGATSASMINQQHFVYSILGKEYAKFNLGFETQETSRNIFFRIDGIFFLNTSFKKVMASNCYINSIVRINWVASYLDIVVK